MRSRDDYRQPNWAREAGMTAHAIIGLFIFAFAVYFACGAVALFAGDDER